MNEGVTLENVKEIHILDVHYNLGKVDQVIGRGIRMCKHINTINGIKIYSFNYIWSYIKSIGVMAQDLLEMPEYKHAVHTTNIGYVVDYSKLPI